MPSGAAPHPDGWASLVAPQPRQQCAQERPASAPEHTGYPSPTRVGEILQAGEILSDCAHCSHPARGAALGSASIRFIRELTNSAPATSAPAGPAPLTSGPRRMGRAAAVPRTALVRSTLNCIWADQGYLSAKILYTKGVANLREGTSRDLSRHFTAFSQDVDELPRILR
jgi:hypothetical protein